VIFELVIDERVLDQLTCDNFDGTFEETWQVSAGLARALECLSYEI